LQKFYDEKSRQWHKGLLEERRLEKPDMAKMKALWAKIVDSWGPQGGPQEKRGDIGPADAGKLHATYRSNYGYKTGEWAKAVIAIDEAEKQSKPLPTELPLIKIDERWHLN